MNCIDLEIEAAVLQMRSNTSKTNESLLQKRAAFFQAF